MSKDSKQGSSSTKDCSDCGFEASNKRHHESYWEGSRDPREHLDDEHMRYNSHYYKVIDRQIAENHHTECLGNGNKGGSNQGAGGQSSSKK